MIDSYLREFFSAKTRRKIYALAGLVGLLLTALIPLLGAILSETSWWTVLATVLAALASGMGYLAKANTNPDDAAESEIDYNGEF